MSLRGRLGSGQGSITSQLNQYHQLKAGADFQRHTLRVNGIVNLPYGLMVAGAYFFGSGNRFATLFPGDPTGGATGVNRLRPDEYEAEFRDKLQTIRSMAPNASIAVVTAPGADPACEGEAKVAGGFSGDFRPWTRQSRRPGW